MNEAVGVVLGGLVALAVLAARWRGWPQARLATRLLIAVLALIAVIPGWRPVFSTSQEMVRVVLVDFDLRRGVDVDRLLDPKLWAGEESVDRELIVAVGSRPVVLHDGSPATAAPPLADAQREPGFRRAPRPDLALRWLRGRFEASAIFQIVVLGGESWDWRAAEAGRRELDAVAFASARQISAPPSRRENLGLRFVTTPPVLDEGSDIAVEVEIYGRVGVSRRARVNLVGGGFADLTLRPGEESRRLALRTTVTSGSALVARLEGHEGWDADPRDDAAALPISVARDRPRVLRVGQPGGDWPTGLEPWLGTLSGPVSASSARSMLAATDLVVVENLAAHQPGAIPFMRDLVSFVGSGGGLVLMGAEAAFGAGQWDGSPIDRLSPLGARPSGAKRQVQALVDRSGSMDGARFRAAAAAASAVYESLGERDSFRLLLFGADLQETLWPGGQDSEKLKDYLARVRPGGGTRTGPALDRALSVSLEPETDSIVILLTDAADPETLTPDGFERWMAAARAKPHAVFVLWFDREDSRLEPSLRALSDAGGGRLIAIDDFARLHEPFLEAAQLGMRLESARVTRADGSQSQVAQLLRTRRKEEAEVLVTYDESTVALARSRRGSGQVVAAPVPATAAAWTALLGSPSARAAFMASLVQGQRAAGTRLEVVETAAGDHRYRFESPSFTGGTLELVFGDGTLRELNPRVPGVWESRPLLGEPDLGPALVRDPQGKERVRLPFASWRRTEAPILSRPPEISLRRLLEAGPRSAPARRAAGLLVLALGLLVIDLLWRAFRTG